METTINPFKTPKFGSHQPEQKQLEYLGYLLLLASFATYCTVEYLDLGNKGEHFALFFLHYFIAWTYAGILIYNDGFGIRNSWRPENLGNTITVLNLFLLSAYALNREIPVFEDSTPWLCVYIVVTSLTMLSFRFFDSLSIWVNRFQYFLLGSAIVFYIYLAILISKVYLFGSIGVLFFGIGAHVLAPITLLIASVLIIRYTFQSKPISLLWISSGGAATLLIVFLFMAEWTRRIEQIEKLANQSVLYNTSELPIWVNVAQSIPNDWITERILKTSFVYTTQKDKFNDWDFMPTNVTWDEVKKHDPLVLLATLSAECSLTKEDRVKILTAIANGRHQANERLWTGDNLATSYIISDIDVYPDLRIAYTEKYLNIRNDSKGRGWWGNSEEAIYTFQVPEGSVVTSLSLWINGTEQKGVLTSKQKADTAYKTIVGVERHDPSLIHWQEGNTITARVFPCTHDEERKFKIGITSPLTESNGQIVYKSTVFRGPHTNTTKETIRVRVLGSSKGLQLPPTFKKDKNGDYVSEGKYDPQFKITLPAVPLRADNRFTFDGFDYSIAPGEVSNEPFVAERLYLDLNSSWTHQELDAIQQLKGARELFVYTDDQFLKLTDENWTVAKELSERNFSLFPFHLLKETDHSLILTKGKQLSPHVSDFKDSKFATGVNSFFAMGKKAHVFNLGPDVSTYISSLREFRAFEFAEGDLPRLQQLLKTNQYPSTIENDERIALHDANLVITKKKSLDSTAASNAPDHLARLFAYNDIMRKVGAHYFADDFINADLVNEAQSAYVVSPVSSLIVLETQQDYDRFNIHDKENSLHNAAKESSGAVPEPHEWALIALFLAFVLYIKFKPSQLKVGL